MYSKIKKCLTSKYHQQSGRNNQGLITVRHRGGGTRRRMRLIDNLDIFIMLKV